LFILRENYQSDILTVNKHRGRIVMNKISYKTRGKAVNMRVIRNVLNLSERGLYFIDTINS